jgi:hypothetical protein
VGRAYRAGTLPFADPAAEDGGRGRRRILTPSLKRAGVALLKTVPRADGWGRTRCGSCTTLALEVPARRGMQGSAEALRRWLHDRGGVWKRTKLVATADAPQRVEKLARLRLGFERLPAQAALFFADELDSCGLPKGGYQGMPKGDQVEVWTPGTKEKRYLAGARALATGTTQPWVWYRNPPGLLRALLAPLDRADPAPAVSRLSVVGANSKIP